MVNSRVSIVKTLLYAEIFDYPLTQKEIYKYLISEKKVSQAKLSKEIKSLKNKIILDKGYAFFKNKDDLANKRIRRKKESEEKLNFAIKVIKKLIFIPTVKFIGISGALSMKNCEKNDDIDIFVITEEKTIWTTRILLIMYLKLLRIYRGRNIKNIKNKICVNMIIDDKNLNFKNKDRNLYTAHEIAQLIPVFNKKNIYKIFLKTNIWINDFLPNFKSDKKPYFKNKNSWIDELLIKIISNSNIENFLGLIQKKYMEKFITNEKIEEGFLAFHPFDYKYSTLKKYNQKLKKENLI